MDVNAAIYMIRSKEKMIKADFEHGEGHTKSYLEGRIATALQTTKAELSKQVKDGYFTRREAKGIYDALAAMPILECLPTGDAVATFPEFKANELFIHSVAIRLESK